VGVKPSAGWSVAGTILLLWLSACAPGIATRPTSTPTSASTCQHVHLLGALMKEVSLGESIVVRWQIDATPVTTTGTPTQGAQHVALSAQLIGPFSSPAAIKQATTADGAGVNGPVALSSQPITDVCRN